MALDHEQPSAREATLARLGHASADLAWIVSRVTPAMEQMAPVGGWSVRQILAHMVMYEERYALATIARMAQGEPADRIEISGTESDLQTPSPELVALDARELHARLRDLEGLRDRWIAGMSEAQFITPVPTVWRMRSPQWVVEKALGHLWEHGVSILYVTLFAA